MIQREKNRKTDTKPRVKQTRNRREIFSVCFAFLFSVCFALPLMGQAAEMFFSSEIRDPKLDEIFQVDVYLNTQNEEINALEGKIIFPKDKIDLQEIKAVGSVINLWFDRPRVETLKDTNVNTNKHESIGGDSCLYSCKFVSFGGIIPGGYNENKGLILSLVFRAIDNGQVKFSFKDLKISLNDGLGTETKIYFYPFSFQIASSGLNVVAGRPVVSDKIPPEEFFPSLGRDASIFENKWFVAFVAEDKQSGISHYKIAEKRSIQQENDFNDLLWESAVSPYVLKDQKLKSFIYVKAVDNDGNSRIIAIPPTNAWSWYEKPLFWIIMIIGVFLFIIWHLWRRYTKIYQ